LIDFTKALMVGLVDVIRRKELRRNGTAKSLRFPKPSRFVNNHRFIADCTQPLCPFTGRQTVNEERAARTKDGERKGLFGDPIRIFFDRTNVVEIDDTGRSFGANEGKIGGGLFAKVAQ